MSTLSGSSINLAIIGGSGLYHLNSTNYSAESEQAEFIEISTPFAKSVIRLNQERLNTTSVYFIPRHGAQHDLPLIK